MKSRTKLASGIAALALVAMTAVALQAPAQARQDVAPKPVPVSGAQAKPSIAAGSKDNASPKLKPLGPTVLQKLDSKGKPVSSTKAAAPAIGYDSSVDFSTVYQYCQGNLLYTTVRNYSAVTKYFEVVLSANGVTRTLYTSVAAGGTAYPTWYGVTGTWYAYLYVWNGSSYAYDEYKTADHNCSVGVTWNTTAVSGYVLETITNYGTTYASVVSNELAPYGGAGTYTGSHWDYPAAGGGVVYRYHYVGTGLRFGIYADLYGADGYTPWYRYA